MAESGLSTLRSHVPSLDESSMSQRDRAYHRLRRLLILQQINEGQRLREPALSEQLGVNRMALREAFARLEAEGLIARGARIGYVVPRMTERDMREVLQVRTLLECGAIEQIVAAGKTKPRHLQPLREACNELEAFANSNYLLGGTEADRRFHERLVEMAGNRRLATIYQRAPLPMIHAPLVSMPPEQWSAELKQSVTDHRRIIEQMSAGKAAEAQDLLRQHLSDRYFRSTA